jgi:transposase
MQPSKENLRFYVYVESRRGRKAADILHQLQVVFGNAAPGIAFVYKWMKEFKENLRESLDDLPRCGRPVSTRTDSNISRVFDFISDEPKSSLSLIADSLQLSKPTVKRIVTEDLLLKKICSVWVPHKLSEDNKLQRVACAQRLIHMFASHSLEYLLRLFAVTDETWIFFESCPSKAENQAWIVPGAPRPRVIRQELTFKKTMLSIAFTGNGKVNMDVTEKGETIDSQRYIEFVRKTGDLWRTLRSDPTRLSEVIWMQDNARPHTAVVTKEFFERRHVERMEQSPYSPDFNLCDRWLIKEVKKHLRTLHLSSATEVLNAAAHHFSTISSDRFANELAKLQNHCVRVINAFGDYVTK